MDGGDRLAAEVLGVEDHDVGRVGRRVVHVAHDPAVVLVRRVVDRGVGIAGDEHHLLGRAARPEVVHFDRAVDQVVLVARALITDEADGVAVASGSAETSLVMARELMTAVVETLFDGAAGGGVEGPAVEGWLTLGRPVGNLAEHRRMASDLHLDQAVGQVEGVERMEDVAGVDLAPPHVVGGAVEGENADASGLVVDPHVGQLVALHRPLEVESAREVEQQHR